ncbi:unnamed protein product, partial [Polarella glacialis]
SGFLRQQQLIQTQLAKEHLFQGLPSHPRQQFGKSVTKGDKRLRIRIRDLLDTVGLNLDQECDICPEFNISGEAARLRRTGVELDVTLFYSNLWFSWNKPWTWIFPDKDITFEVQVSARQPVEGVRTIRTAGRSQLLKQVPQGVEARVTGPWHVAAFRRCP